MAGLQERRHDHSHGVRSSSSGGIGRGRSGVFPKSKRILNTGPNLPRVHRPEPTSNKGTQMSSSCDTTQTAALRPLSA